VGSGGSLGAEDASIRQSSLSKSQDRPRHPRTISTRFRCRIITGIAIAMMSVGIELMSFGFKGNVDVLRQNVMLNK
jgi:hypothetical protein